MTRPEATKPNPTSRLLRKLGLDHLDPIPDLGGPLIVLGHDDGVQLLFETGKLVRLLLEGSSRFDRLLLRILNSSRNLADMLVGPMDALNDVMKLLSEELIVVGASNSHLLSELGRGHPALWALGLGTAFGFILGPGHAPEDVGKREIEIEADPGIPRATLTEMRFFFLAIFDGRQVVRRLIFLALLTGHGAHGLSFLSHFTFSLWCRPPELNRLFLVFSQTCNR